MSEMILTVVTPTKNLVQDIPVDSVQVVANRGELDILPGHSPLVTTLETGVLQYKEVGVNKVQKAAISWGYLEVFNNKVSVLAETAETAEEIDLQRANISLEKSVQASQNTEDMMKYLRKAQRAEVRIAVAKSKDSSH